MTIHSQIRFQNQLDPTNQHHFGADYLPSLSAGVAIALWTGTLLPDAPLWQRILLTVVLAIASIFSVNRRSANFPP